MQTSLTYRTNRDLFSNHYLDEHLPETEAWEEVSDAELDAAREEILDLWGREKDTAPERNEAQLEEKFIRPMFRKLGIPFEVEASVSRTQRRPDYGFFETTEAARKAFDRRKKGDDFYKNAVAVADAKRWGRPLDTRGSGEHDRDFENPSYQIHVYLQETPTRWAVLTDGKKWRLYYGPTSHRLDSYYEVDLPTILEQGDLEDFKYFYLFFRHEAFVEDATGDCFLDDVYEESNVFAEELGEDLQENIYEAIRVLSEGFIQHHANDLDEEELDLVHDSSLIYLYRIIFVLYAEAEGRDLLDTDNPIYEERYSINTLKRNVAEELDSDNPKYTDWGTDIWDRLDELFLLIDQGSKQMGIPEEDLYIPAYNGGLFRTDPDEGDSPEARFLAEHEVGDGHLARVIELLTRSANAGNGTTGEGKIFVDYSSLDVRHLGSIYEGLLEYQLNVAYEDLAVNEDGEYVPAEDGKEVVVTADDIYLTTDSGERKATGSYYTPEYVVEYIVENTLEPLVDECRAAALEKRGSYEGLAQAFADEVFGLKVLDPAMGSGHFLTSAVDYLAREIIDAQEKQAAQEGMETVDEEQDINWARRQVAQRCIYGVDLNPLAVELAKVSLWLRTLAAEQPLAFLDHHLKTGNSLVGSDIETVLDNGDPDSGTEDGQLTLQASFDRTRQQALEHVTDQFEELLAIDNETLDDIKEMEAVYEDARDDPLYQHLIAMANVHTAEQFGLDVPADAYERMAAALRDDSWESIEGQDWYRSAQAMADDERFFHWELEFPIAFYEQDGERKEDGGFDAVIGNPPYVKIQNLDGSIRTTYEKMYDTARERFDIYNLFAERGYELSCNNIGYILPNKFFESNGGKPLREYIADKKALSEVVDFGKEQVFSEVSTYTCLLFLTKERTEEPKYSLVTDEPRKIQEQLDFRAVSVPSAERWNFLSPIEAGIASKVEETGTPLRNVASQIFVGIQTSADKIFVLQECEVDEDTIRGYSRSLDSTVEIEKSICHPYATGDEIGRYSSPNSAQYLIYPYDDEGNILQESELTSNYPKAIDYLEKNREVLSGRGGKNQQFETWFAHWCPRTPAKFEREKILIPEIVKGGEATLDEEGELYHSTTVYSPILPNDSSVTNKSILPILNSKLIWFYIKMTGTVLRGGYYRYKTEYLEPIGIPLKMPSEIESKTEQIIDYTNHYKALNLNLLDYLGIPSDELPESKAGKTLEAQQMPVAGVADTPLTATTEEYEGLRVEGVSVEDDGGRVVLSVDISYKPAEEDPRETDRWGRLAAEEFETYDAMAFVGLSDAEEMLLREFVPVAVEQKGGFAGFRQNATKTNSPLDRLKALRLPDIEAVQAGLEQYVEVRERADELEAKIEKTDALIDEIVYDLYGLTDEEIEIVEEAVQDD